MSCEFCKKNFSSEQSLSVHQKSTKSCLLIQERMGYKVTKKAFPCDYCSQEFTARSSLQYHIKKCSKKSPSVIRIIEEKTRHIEGDMGDKIEQLSSDFKNYKEEVEYEFKKIKEELHKQDEKIKELEEYIKIKNIENTLEFELDKQIYELYEKVNRLESLFTNAQLQSLTIPPPTQPSPSPPQSIPTQPSPP